jgi:hypothetical protein
MSLQTKLGINEYYCPLIDYPNYAVSNYGNVKNRNTDKILKPDLTHNGYLRVKLYHNDNYKKILIHRLVISTFEANPDNKKCVDHIDNDTKNNELFNLRFATRQENGYNRKLNNNNTSGIKGVYFHKPANKWIASISINKKRFHIGLYDNIEGAIKARQEKAKELFGVFMNNCEK